MRAKGNERSARRGTRMPALQLLTEHPVQASISFICSLNCPCVMSIFADTFVTVFPSLEDAMAYHIVHTFTDYFSHF